MNYRPIGSCIHARRSVLQTHWQPKNGGVTGLALLVSWGLPRPAAENESPHVCALDVMAASLLE
jgi:hypothetical protein